MAVVTNVFRRGDVYWFRVRVPDRLRTVVGRRELWRSLRTRQAGEARRRGVVLHGLTEALWRDLERAMTPSESKALVDAWLRHEIRYDAYLRYVPGLPEKHVAVVLRKEPPYAPDSVVRTLDHDDFEKLQRLSPAKLAAEIGADCYVREEVTDFELARAGQEKVFSESERRFAEEDETIATEHVRRLFDLYGIEVNVFSAHFEVATKLMMRAHADLWRVIRQRDDAKWRQYLDDDPAAELLTRLDASAAPQPEERFAGRGGAAVSSAPSAAVMTGIAAKPFSTAAAEAVPEIARLEGFNLKRIDDYRAAAKAFQSWHGGDPTLGELTPEMVGAFKVALTQYPSNASKRLPYRDLASFADRIEAARKLGEARVLDPTTINGKYLTPLRRIFDWHRENGLKSDNPFEGIRVRGARTRDPRARRRNFTNTEVVRLLSLPLFTGAAADRSHGLYKPGPVRISDWRFWVPLICLFSGMRLNEACGLALVDFKREAGVDFIHVRDETEGQSLKAEASRRKVPVHSELIRVGLLDHVARLRAAGAVRLFDELQPDAKGYFSGKPSKFFLDLLPKIADEDPDSPGKLTFHSTRHTVVSKLRAANVRKDVSMAIVGHEQGDDTHAEYGEYDVAALRAGVDKIAYPGLDLSRVVSGPKS